MKMDTYLCYKLFKVKDGKLEKLKAWAEELQRRKSEVLATLEYENVAAETMFLFSAGSETFVMGMQALAGEHRKADMTVEVNKRHFDIIAECLTPYEGTVLYEFVR